MIYQNNILEPKNKIINMIDYYFGKKKDRLIRRLFQKSLIEKDLIYLDINNPFNIKVSDWLRQKIIEENKYEEVKPHKKGFFKKAFFKEIRFDEPPDEVA